MLGGSNSLNYLFYVRGDARDYDNWKNLGHTGWSYKEVLPYFLKSEKQIVIITPASLRANYMSELKISIHWNVKYPNT